MCHPKEEHLVPMFVNLGAAKGERGEVLFETNVLGVKTSSFIFRK